MNKAQAETVKSRIEFLIAAKENGTAPDAETSRWLGSIGDDLHTKLAKHELVAPRTKATITTLVGQHYLQVTDADHAKLQMRITRRSSKRHNTWEQSRKDRNSIRKIPKKWTNLWFL